jgi:hypothetical protein
MPSETINHQFPFPNLEDPVDVSGDFGRLAADIDEKLQDIVLGVIDSAVTDSPQTGISVSFNEITEKIVFNVNPVFINEEVDKMFDHEDHIGINATYDSAKKQINLQVTDLGGGGGGGSGTSSLTTSWWLGV